ncbi:urea ABC transporter substrate-binding protein [Ketogulonicigenium vulgare]|uniref:ABC-type branched-chain amino acid transport systems periplasmic component-like protein n=1 Tax=Ketogulonicigenium vulgare (strain WSH-001) TaxID=759362 RepID=F9Y4B1_KETVW|nr:urea ABC transporter substrate-binding protein [Ketogulonicigenium vulgare]ADO43440.1 branched-chain amino acid ABC transporter, periplasmic substrate-binding protein [Ketogulonicigenium vulgare Y25]AEM41724.1 ABC-type branched-chain amino acid transport systems periplasmic component-like protein [Ketogulonicigenium vulgare WSH-001]ALJ82409.1 branched-chain amino acid ABC transporter substrate-binding protein [Ketogulonicigenium vulgare]ANW34488.1 urea ABC transporter substrate-binding prote
MKRLATLSTLSALAVVASAGAALAQDACPIRVGVLHSLSGSMAISETTLKDAMLMLVAQQNAAGGLLGCEIETVVVDPASDWPLFAEQARDLLTVNEVDVIFGAWTSVSRKAVLPVLEELNGLMFYPVQYEGEESSRNVFYTGAAPNQQAIPAVDYFLEELGVTSFALLGTDYVYPRTTNNILEAYLIDKGIAPENIFVNYTPFSHSDWATIVSDVVALGAGGGQVGVISTINGDANIGFYTELAAQGVSADDIPVVAFSVGEEELSGLDTAGLVGHLAAWNYFMSADTPENAAFIEAWHEFIGSDTRVTNDPMEAHYIGFNMWVNAVEQVGTTDVDAVIDALPGQTFPNLTGGIAEMLPNHHLTKPVLIGEIRADGQFDIISQTEPVPGDAWTDFLPESAILEADWVDLKCGMYNTQTQTCVQLTSNY